VCLVCNVQLTSDKWVPLTRAGRCVVCVVDYPAAASDDIFKVAILCLDTCFSASEMTYIVSRGALNSTHSLTPVFYATGQVHNPPRSDFSSMPAVEHCFSFC